MNHAGGDSGHGQPIDDLVIFGAGGHAKSVIAVIEHQRRWRIAALLEDAAVEPGRSVLGYPVVGGIAMLPQLRESGVRHAFVAVGDDHARLRIADAIRNAGFALANVVHPSACIMKEAVIGQGVFVHALSLVGPECVVGDNVIVSTMASVGHETRLGDGVHIAPGVRIGGGCHFGAACFVGPNAVIHPRTRIGHNVRIAANAVVTGDVEDNVVVAGMPARVVRRD